ncbi:MAG: pyrroline-5-carboxylate reductase [Lachnospiraceae bacterium]|nr:pyrroline-5-carboxylate reductase [Lachnospiraceae bacterium]
MRIGFIGAGNMGFPLLKGAAAAFEKENVTFLTKRREREEEIAAQLGISYAPRLLDMVMQSDIIVLAVKPQYAAEVYPDVRLAMSREKIVVSVMAGVDMAALKKETGAVKLVRTMPNTPAMLGEGMTCISYSDAVSEVEKEVIRTLFSCVGKIEEIPERLMNAAICANGSSPAFVYLFMEALADAVVKYGIPRDMAYRLVGQTVLGSAKMLLDSGKHPGALKDAVCSPGGTTIAGIAALEEYGLRNAVIKAADACYERACEMEREREVRDGRL